MASLLRRVQQRPRPDAQRGTYDAYPIDRYEAMDSPDPRTHMALPEQVVEPPVMVEPPVIRPDSRTPLLDRIRAVNGGRAPRVDAKFGIPEEPVTERQALQRKRKR